MSKHARIFRIVLLALLITTNPPVSARDMGDPVATVNAFQAALASGDEAVVRSLLAPDVLIYESGGQENSREEYASHHMKGDMAFLGASQVKRLDQAQQVYGDLAVINTRSRITGKHKEKDVDVNSTETIVLKRLGAGWQIVHIHWSSRPVAPKAK